MHAPTHTHTHTCTLLFFFVCACAKTNGEILVHFIHFCSIKCDVLYDQKCVCIHVCEHTTLWSYILLHMKPGNCNSHEALKLALIGMNFHASEELHYAIQNYFCLKRFLLNDVMPLVNNGSCLSGNKVRWEVIWVICTLPGRYSSVLIFTAGICWLELMFWNL